MIYKISIVFLFLFTICANASDFNPNSAEKNLLEEKINELEKLIKLKKNGDQNQETEKKVIKILQEQLISYNHAWNNRFGGVRGENGQIKLPSTIMSKISNMGGTGISFLDNKSGPKIITQFFLEPLKTDNYFEKKFYEIAQEWIEVFNKEKDQLKRNTMIQMYKISKNPFHIYYPHFNIKFPFLKYLTEKKPYTSNITSTNLKLINLTPLGQVAKGDALPRLLEILKNPQEPSHFFVWAFYHKYFTYKDKLDESNPYLVANLTRYTSKERIIYHTMYYWLSNDMDPTDGLDFLDKHLETLRDYIKITYNPENPSNHKLQELVELWENVKDLFIYIENPSQD